MSDGPYYLNDLAEDAWEICRGLTVEFTIPKTADDDNRDEAQARVDELNAAHAEVQAMKANGRL